MSQAHIILLAVFPVFCITGAGILLRKTNCLSEEADQSLLRVTINLLAPCLAFDSILHNDALRHFGNIALPPLIGFATVAIGIGLSLLCRRLAGALTPKQAATFAVSAGLYNYTYLPIPLAQALFDRETVGVLFVFNVGVDISLWTLVLMMLSGGSIGRDWKRMFNVPVISILTALVLNLIGADRYIPDPVMKTVKILGQCAVPMGVILVGAIMADHAGGFRSASGWRTILAGCFLRLGLLPLLMVLLAWSLPCSMELKRILILQGAMPTAVFTIVMSKHYAGDPLTALRLVIGTSVAALVTIPLWLRFGFWVIGQK